MSRHIRRAGHRLLREAPVPAIMLLCVGGYWMNASGLSVEALAFPAALTAVVGLALLAVLVSAAGTSDDAEPAGGGLPAAARAWAIVLLPVPLILGWREIGALPMLAVLAAGLMMVLRERRWPWLIGLPVLLSVGLVYVFKTLLYVRLPAMPWSGG